VILRTTHHLKEVEVTQEIEIVLSSRPTDQMDAAAIQAFRRGHWAIESNHCVRDVSFGEDFATVRTGHGPRNLATLRNLVIGLCGLDGARRQKRSSGLPSFRRKAQNDRQIAIDLVARPLLKPEAG
jgi:hypothetical protein